MEGRRKMLENAITEKKKPHTHPKKMPRKSNVQSFNCNTNKSNETGHYD